MAVFTVAARLFERPYHLTRVGLKVQNNTNGLSEMSGVAGWRGYLLQPSGPPACLVYPRRCRTSHYFDAA